jgi:hypothetical protein
MKISLCAAMRLFQLVALAGLCLTSTTTSAFLMHAAPQFYESSTNLCAFKQSREDNSKNVYRISRNNKKSNTQHQVMSQAALTAALVVSMAFCTGIPPAHADGATKTFKLPPIDYTDQSRCVLKSSNMGQANAARDKLVDLRECKIPDANARGFDLSGVLMYVLTF